MTMRKLIWAGTALLLINPALAQDKTLDPNAITVSSQRQQLQLSDHQRDAVQNALETENTEQKTPPKFEAKIGDPVPASMTVDVMPESLVQSEPSLKQYGYAKLPKDVLVIDPLKKTIIAVLPRRSPTSGKDVAPADWAAQRGRELTGQAPEPSDSKQAPQPAGDSGDKKNGTEATSSEKQ
jgi:hypothetical protein